ncbi:MAG TPA: chorismate mutase, partial [Rubrobacter sp.]|nr:chorismate mutase [Rubrobacter sp.]
MTLSDSSDKKQREVSLADSGETPPGEMEALRQGIVSVDEEIVRLLDRRAWLARRIGEIKHENGLAAYAPARERAVLDRVAALSEGEFPRRGLEAVYR